MENNITPEEDKKFAEMADQHMVGILEILIAMSIVAKCKLIFTEMAAIAGFLRRVASLLDAMVKEKLVDKNGN